ncbi:MAG TPA: thioredoxin family protein [Thermoanaerobaculia bacterium]|nr:thioredoxin family protein [Thermoanaerobaculia bacterium]
MFRRGLLAGLTLIVASAIVAAPSHTEWTAVERDGWIDQRLERPLLIYRAASPHRLLLLSDRFAQAVVLDIESGVVSFLGKEHIEIDDDLVRATTVERLGARPQGRVSMTEDGVVMASVGRKSVVIGKHRSRAGDLDRALLLHEHPAWDAGRDRHQPNEDAIAALRDVNEPVDLTVVLATWCGDSRREVPRLLKAIDTAGNPNLRVRLVGIDSEFHEPMDVIQEMKITNVPTVIVESGGKELGRIVETTASESIERDLAAIIEGRPEPHAGRWPRGERLARGLYEIRFADGRTGFEEWEVFATAGEGRLAHSTIRTNSMTREVWHRFDSAGRTAFIEITDQGADGLRRARYRPGDGRLSVHSRGNLSGIVDQVIGIPPSCAFSTGSLVTSGWECVALRSGGSSELTRYVLPLNDCAVLGCLEQVRLDRGSSSEIELVHGRYRVDEVSLASDHETIDFWIGSALDLPLRIEAAGWTAELTDLEITPPS